ncbi:hypothetical protein WMY93_026756 [Mugilogobius chulae]|uniref:Scaffolding anchor of CK1 domain-containing protein n=1 Tax=Mugilogobius chulae TaxID=88201 RepID=A0AAW0NAB5_9GOBI
MDANSVSPLWLRRVKLQGKIKRRVQDLRIPSSPSLDFLTSRPTLDLSHNESARLALDGLLSCGLGAYQEALKTEGEVDFLSELEKKYFLENGKESNTNVEPDADDDNGFERSSYSSHSVPLRSSEFTDCESREAGSSCKEDENEFSHMESNVNVYLYTENRAAGLKDVIREFIRKAEKSLVVVTDHFSDVELLCDLLEASKKRFVRNFSVYSVEGQTYSAKTGKKLSGQLSETFIITDSTEALAGSFSFSCLTWMVHRSFAFLVKGSAVTQFLEELERLSSCSTPVTEFINVPLSLPFKISSQTKKNSQRISIQDLSGRQ